MKILMMAALILIVGCGNNTDTYTYVENPYDDSQIKSYEVLTNARILATESRITQLELIAQNHDADIEVLSDQVESDYTALNNLINALQNKVHTNKIVPYKICGSNEYLLKLYGKYYAVYMVNNNHGTYLGALDENVAYQTTDVIHSRFSIVSGVIICQ